MEEGYVFTGIRHSVHNWEGGLPPGREGVCLLSGLPSGGAKEADPPEYGQSAVGTHPTGIHSCLMK